MIATLVALQRPPAGATFPPIEKPKQVNGPPSRMLRSNATPSSAQRVPIVSAHRSSLAVYPGRGKSIANASESGLESGDCAGRVEQSGAKTATVKENESVADHAGFDMFRRALFREWDGHGMLLGSWRSPFSSGTTLTINHGFTFHGISQAVFSRSMLRDKNPDPNCPATCSGLPMPHEGILAELPRISSLIRLECVFAVAAVLCQWR